MYDKLDAFGIILNIGDHVVFTTRYKVLYVGKISKFTKIYVHIDYHRDYPSELIKISKQEYDRFKKHLQ